MPISNSERLGKSYESKSTLVSVGAGQKVDGKKFLGESKYQKYIDELTSSGTIGGEPLSPAERKEGFKKREDKIGFENFVKKILDKKESAVISQGTKKLSGGTVRGGALAVASPKVSPGKLIPQPVGSASEETKENLDEILGKIDSILDTIKNEEKTKKKRDAENRRENEKKKRKKKEQKLESSIFKGLAKQVDKVLKPVKSVFQKIFEFFTAIFFARIVTKIFEWLGDKENQNKVKNLIRFFSDFWPVIAGAYLLFGTKFGKLIRTVGKWAVQIAKFAIPKLLRFVKRNPRTAILLAGAGYLGSRILTSKEVGADDEGEEASTEKPIEMSKGGRVPGSGNKDTVPAMLTPGEFVMSKGAVAKYGVDTLSSMNAMGGGTNIPSLTGMGVFGYQGGGEVSGDPNKPAKAAHGEGVGYSKSRGRRRTGQREEGESTRLAAAPSTTPSPSAPSPKVAASSKSNIISISHPDTGSGYSVKGLKDQQGRPAVFSKGAAEAFAKMMKDSRGSVKGSDIASSKRSRSKNSAVGGARNSNHLYGNALDIHGASQTWMRKNGARYGWHVHDYAGSHGGHFNYKGAGSDQSGGDALVLSGTAKSLIGNDTAFLKRVDEVSKRIGANPADLLGLMASESGLNPQSVNSKSGATGLIQFTPGTASSLGTSTSALKKMNRAQQMDYVEKYLVKYAPNNPTPGHLYTSVFLPAFAKKPANYVVAKEGGFTDSWGHHPASWYSGNAGLDLNKDGSITIAELGERIKQKQKAFGIGGGSAIGGGTLIAGSGGGGGGGGADVETQQAKSKLVYDPQTQSYVIEGEGGSKKLDLFDWEEARRSLGVTPTQPTSTKAESISKPSRPPAVTSASAQKVASVTSAAGGVAGAVGAEKYRTNIPLINSMAMTSTRKIKTLGIMI